ncbi:hypothetical protein MMC07_001922 [Pseudocyphellaria aurata]|nr:hypothetical protein [Pseudocyphellaria aurata]
MEPPVLPKFLVVSLDEDEAYAGTSNSEWQSMVRQMENFKSLESEDIEPANRNCDICLQPFGTSDDSEDPIQLLSCGHIFGHDCIFRWFVTFMPTRKWWDWSTWDAYWPHSSEESFRVNDEDQFLEATVYSNIDDVAIAIQHDGQPRPDWRDYLNWNSNDPADLLPVQPKPSVEIEANLRFWDLVYEKLGISRSAKEEQSRNTMLRYVHMVQSPKINIKPEHMRRFTLRAQVSAVRFALRRGNRDLDPIQTHLRDAIFNLGCYGLRDGEYHATSYEDRRVPLWCFQVGRIERGLSPAFSGILGPMYDTEEGDEDLHTEQLLCEELQEQVSGPWRRSLFAEVGGNRDGLRWKYR